MTKTKDDTKSGNRRDFIKLAGLGTVSGGVALAVAGSAQASEEVSADGANYRETAHVKQFYDLARF